MPKDLPVWQQMEREQERAEDPDLDAILTRNIPQILAQVDRIASPAPAPKGRRMSVDQAKSWLLAADLALWKVNSALAREDLTMGIILDDAGELMPALLFSGEPMMGDGAARLLDQLLTRVVTDPDRLIKAAEVIAPELLQLDAEVEEIFCAFPTMDDDLEDLDNAPPHTADQLLSPWRSTILTLIRNRVPSVKPFSRGGPAKVQEWLLLVGDRLEMVNEFLARMDLHIEVGLHPTSEADWQLFFGDYPVPGDIARELTRSLVGVVTGDPDKLQTTVSAHWADLLEIPEEQLAAITLYPDPESDAPEPDAPRPLLPLEEALIHALEAANLDPDQEAAAADKVLSPYTSAIQALLDGVPPPEPLQPSYDLYSLHLIAPEDWMAWLKRLDAGLERVNARVSRHLGLSFSVQFNLHPQQTLAEGLLCLASDQDFALPIPGAVARELVHHLLRHFQTPMVLLQLAVLQLGWGELPDMTYLRFTFDS